MSSVYIIYGHDFHEIRGFLHRSNNTLTVYQIIIKPNFPSKVDEISEPPSDMNIKVAAFTVSQKSININSLRDLLKSFTSKI